MMNQTWVGQSIPRNWLTWTPSWQNFTPGSAAITARYIRIGNTVHFYLNVVLSGSTMGTQPDFTLPLTAASTYNTTTFVRLFPVHLEDTGNATYFGTAGLISTTRCQIQVDAVGATYRQNAAVTSSVPFTWGNTDVFQVSGTYECA